MHVTHLFDFRLNCFPSNFFLSCVRFAFILYYAGSWLISSNTFLAFISYHQCLCSHTMLSSTLTFSHDRTWKCLEWLEKRAFQPVFVWYHFSFISFCGSITRISHFRDQIWVFIMRTSHFLRLMGYDTWQFFSMNMVYNGIDPNNKLGTQRVSTWDSNPPNINI